MTLQSALLPVFVQVLLVYGLLGALIATRQLARRGDWAPGAARVSWEDAARRVSASYSNQFELPVLFFGLVACALASGRTDDVFVTLEWLFVFARIIHAGVHVTVNIIALRGAVFAASAAILAVAWLKFAADILAG